MSDIKTRESVKDIKVLDKAANAARSIRKATVRTRDGIENLADDGQISPSEYAEDQMKYAAEDTAQTVYDKTSDQLRQGRDCFKEQIREKREEKRLERQEKRVEKRIQDWEKREAGIRKQNPSAEVKKTVSSGRRTVRGARNVKKATVRTKEAVVNNNAVQRAAYQGSSSVTIRQAGIRSTQATERSIRQSARSTGKLGVKTAGKSAKTVQKTVKTAEQASKVTVKTAKASGEAAQKTAAASAKAAKAAAVAAKQAAIAVGKAVAAAAKVVAKAVVAAGKAIASAFTAMAAAIGTGGAIAVVVVAIICAIGLIVGSAFGVFFSSEEGTGGRSMESVVHEINTEYNDRIKLIKEVNTYDLVEMSGSSAVWREVLAFYAVRVSMDDEAGQEVITLSDDKVEILKEIFWEMNTISSEVKEETRTVVEEVPGEDGEIIEKEVEKELKVLYITVSHLSADEMAAKYSLSERQKDTMHQLLSDEYRSIWGSVLYGIKSGDTAIIDVAASQIGNVGGEPYWSMFGFTSRIEWCACFVSCCGNECGYLDNGIMPRAIGCVVSMSWYKERGQWIDGNHEPLPGMIIFYDWDDPDGDFGPQDGKPDHVGIVERVLDGVIYTIEGNSGDSCRRNEHPVGEKVILGYGCPQY